MVNRKRCQEIASLGLALILILATASQTQAQDGKKPYPSLAPIGYYGMTTSLRRCS